ncbi:MAG: hypothetical protein R3F11_28710 [Verrucomicrobiales bacterium]
MLRNDNFGGHVVIWYALIGTLALPPGAPAQVVISEFAAATSEREVIYPVDGSAPRVGPYVPWFDPALLRMPVGGGRVAVWDRLRGGRDRHPGGDQRLRRPPMMRRVRRRSAWSANTTPAFTAFLNGKEVARRNMGSPGYHAAREQEAFNAYVSAAEEVIDLAPRRIARRRRKHSAIQLHNDAVVYSMKMAPWPEIEGAAAPLVAPGESWRYFHGLVEPSGGVFDRSFLAASPGWRRSNGARWLR